MSIRDEIQPYRDQNGLIAPNIVPPGTLVGSDNGSMFTSEYYIILKKSAQLIYPDYADFDRIINRCINPQGMLCRIPIGQNDGQEGPDDYYGVLDGCKALKNTSIPRKLLKGIIKNLGFMDNVNPGSHSNWSSFMPRQPQMMASMISAAFPSWLNPLHILIRTLCFPLYIVAAGTIFISCVGTPPGDTDSRRLSWHLIQTVVPTSLMCKIASLFWYHRLYSVYGITGMRAVAKIYYQPNHPFAKYWVT